MAAQIESVDRLAQCRCRGIVSRSPHRTEPRSPACCSRPSYAAGAVPTVGRTCAAGIILTAANPASIPARARAAPWRLRAPHLCATFAYRPVPQAPSVNTLQAIAIFAGAPLAIFGIIVAAVYASTARATPRRPDPPVGITVEQEPCTVHRAEDGSEVHERATGPATDRARVCWTVRCAECGTGYSEGAKSVHFTGPGHAVSVTDARGWRLAGARMRCPRCA